MVGSERLWLRQEIGEPHCQQAVMLLISLICLSPLTPGALLSFNLPVVALSSVKPRTMAPSRCSVSTIIAFFNKPLPPLIQALEGIERAIALQMQHSSNVARLWKASLIPFVPIRSASCKGNVATGDEAKSRRLPQRGIPRLHL